MRLKLFFVLIALLNLLTIVDSQSQSPEPRAGHELVWHAGLERVLLVNGDHVSSQEAGKIWAWDGESWEIISDDAPPSRSLGGAAYDEQNNRLVLYGGSLSIDDVSDETWLWDGEDWENVEEATIGNRDHFGMSYTPDGIILYGGTHAANNEQWSDTWLWDGENWTQLSEEGPSLYHFAFAYDSVREQLLLFGGTNGRSDTRALWAWGGEAWEQIDSGTGPSARAYARMACDSGNEVTVLFGGMAGFDPLNDTWLWDGENWTEYESEIRPPARGFAAMAYDPIREKIVMFGGSGEMNYGDTWEWDMENGWVEVTP